MAVVGRVGRGAFAEKGIRLVEEENPVAVLRHIEYLGEVLFRFADIL